jgi:hypothetical protein
MYRIVSIVGFVIAILIAFKIRFGKPEGACFSAAGKDNRFVGLIKALVVVFGMLSAAVLIITGFASRLIFGTVIDGYLLMLHAMAAPVFMACVAASAVLWASEAKLSLTDFGAAGEKPVVCLRKRVGFWVILVLTVPLILSLMLCMLHIFGTHMQEILAGVHRWSALPLAMVIIFEIVCTGKSCGSKKG